MGYDPAHEFSTAGAGARRWAGDAIAGDVARIRTHLGAYAHDAGASDAVVADVRLAASEALTNAVMHAYPPGAPGRMEARINAEPATGVMSISVRDYGAGFRPRVDSPGMGVGLSVIGMLARTMEIASPPDGGTEIQLTFALVTQRTA